MSWEDHTKAAKQAYNHAKQTGHTVHGETGFAFKYNWMRKIDLSKTNGTLNKHLEKAMMHQHYKNAMVESFKENFEVIQQAGIDELRKSFLKIGKSARYFTAEEYADLAVETFNEVSKMRWPEQTDTGPGNSIVDTSSLRIRERE